LFAIRELRPVLPLEAKALFFLMLGAFLFIGQTRVWAGTYSQAFEQGKVDWTNGVVEVFAMGSPPAHALSPAQARALAESEAETLARNDLIGLLESLRIDSKSTVKEVLDRQGVREELVAAIVRDSSVVEKSVLADGKVKVAVTFRLNGSFADLVLPKSIMTIKTVEQAPRKEESFTGLIIDCRGIPLNPALAPMIVDEDGQVIYGTAYVSRDHALEEGMAAYARGLAKARDNPRVGAKPLIVKGLRTVKARPSDIVISNADAGKIRGAGSNISFLHRGRVLFVME
jgi:sulfur carrier protein ThiS